MLMKRLQAHTWTRWVSLQSRIPPYGQPPPRIATKRYSLASPPCPLLLFCCLSWWKKRAGVKSIGYPFQDVSFGNFQGRSIRGCFQVDFLWKYAMRHYWRVHLNLDTPPNLFKSYWESFSATARRSASINNVTVKASHMSRQQRIYHPDHWQIWHDSH